MPGTWSEWLAATLGLLAALYLLVRARGFLRVSRRDAGCGGCGSCAQGTPPTLGRARPLVTLAPRAGLGLGDDPAPGGGRDRS